MHTTHMLSGWHMRNYGMSNFVAGIKLLHSLTVKFLRSLVPDLCEISPLSSALTAIMYCYPLFSVPRPSFLWSSDSLSTTCAYSG